MCVCVVVHRKKRERNWKKLLRRLSSGKNCTVITHIRLLCCVLYRRVLSKQAKAQLRRKSQRIQEALVRSHDSHMTSHDLPLQELDLKILEGIAERVSERG